MAEGDKQSQPEVAEVVDEQKLKYLEFVQIIVLQAAVWFASIYNKAKDKSGTLKPGIENVEEKVKMVVAPVYWKYHSAPMVFLKFLDQKVDQSVAEVNRLAPSAVKQVSAQAVSAAQQAPEVARGLAAELQRSGMVDAASGLAKSVCTKYEPVAKGLYAKFEPVAEQYAVSTWNSLNRLPLFPQVAHVIVPTAAFCSEMYNSTVRSSADKGYKVASYLPLVPTQKIAKVFQGTAAEKEKEPLVSAREEAPVH